ncbi:MAG TPA: hypothetical protein VN722_00100 [Hanamia sp.]|nr:hypothetical protein [Hanamia sp.]
MDTMLIELTNKKAAALLHELEELRLIKVLREEKGVDSIKNKLSQKYKGIISKKQGQELNQHIKQMRSEWNNI